MHTVKEVKHFLGYVLPQQLVRVLILTFIFPGLFGLNRFQINGSQLCVGHIHCLLPCQSSCGSQSHLVLKVTATQVVESFGCVHVVFAVCDHLLKFVCRPSPVKVEVNLCFLNRNTQVGFKRLKG